MTVMFADVSGSTALFERLGDREAMHAIERCLKRMKRSIGAYKGETLQIVGDEMLVSFASAEEACLAAIDMQQRITDLPPVSGLKLTIRIGLHSGLLEKKGDKLEGGALTTAARIAGLARRDQILCSSQLVAELPQPGVITIDPMPDLGKVTEKDAEFDLHQIHWPSYQGLSYPQSLFGMNGGAAGRLLGERLCLRYRGKAFLVDDKTPVLTIGRDLACKLIIDDRKASRRHARIERREDGFYIVDTSTNGCFVTLEGRHEVMVKSSEMSLDSKGKISFGGPLGDAQSQSAEFEYL